MKKKSLVLDASIIIINICISFVTVYFVFMGKENSGIISGLMGAFLGFQFSHLFRYWGMKLSDFGTSQINKEKAMKTWQYIIFTFSIAMLFLQFCYIDHIFESLKFASLYFLAWMIITGNFKATTDPILETLSIYTDDDEDVKRKTQRFSGKFSFFFGIIGVVLVLILPQKLGLYICIFLFFISVLLPAFYAKIIFNKKYA